MLPTAADHNKRRHAQQGHAADGEHPRAVAAGFGEVKTGVVDDCQRHDGIALRHADVLTVDGTGGGQQLGTALLTSAVFLGGDDDLDRFLEENITLIRGSLGQGIGVILQPLHHHMTLCVGNEGGSVRFLGGEALGVIHAVLLLSNHIHIVGIVVQQELHVLHLAAVVTELLENVDAVGVDMAAVLQRVKIGGVGALPSQHNLVGVVLVAHLGVGGQCGGVGDAHGAVGIAPLHAVGVNALRLVDLAQTRLGHADGHGVGGIIGTILLGIFASKDVNGISGLIEGDVHQFGIQIFGTLLASAYAFVITMLILKVVNKFLPVRVTPEEERIGLDASLHHEEAYHL